MISSVSVMLRRSISDVQAVPRSCLGQAVSRSCFGDVQAVSRSWLIRWYLSISVMFRQNLPGHVSPESYWSCLGGVWVAFLRCLGHVSVVSPSVVSCSCSDVSILFPCFCSASLFWWCISAFLVVVR